MAKVNGVIASIAEVLDALPSLPAEIDRDLVEELDYDFRQHRDEVRWGPPTPPGREVWEYDEGDNELHYVRDCTPEEIAEREAAYAKLYAEWDRTGGLAFTAGPAVARATLKLSDGRYFKLVGDGKTAWAIVEEGHA